MCRKWFEIDRSKLFPGTCEFVCVRGCFFFLHPIKSGPKWAPNRWVECWSVCSSPSAGLMSHFLCEHKPDDRRCEQTGGEKKTKNPTPNHTCDCVSLLTSVIYFDFFSFALFRAIFFFICCSAFLSRRFRFTFSSTIPRLRSSLF